MADLTDAQKEQLRSLCNFTGIAGQRKLLFALLTQLMLQFNAAS